MTEQPTQRPWQQALLAGLLVAVPALLPFGRLSELPILILAVWGLGLLVSRPLLLWQHESVKTLIWVFLAYFLMTLISSLDSAWPQKSWLITAASVRFLLMGMVVLYLASHETLKTVMKWVALLAVFWSVDAMVQYVAGVDLLGRASYPGRLTGVFGENVKLGPVMALLLPILMIQSHQVGVLWRWLGVSLAVLVILLSGTRSAWLMMAFVLLMYAWHHVQGRRWLLLLKSTALMVLGVLLLWYFSADFKQRVDRSIHVLNGDVSALDYALADRLPIWHTAIEMYQSHPINGVGASAFRSVYQDFAAEDDVWVQQQGQGLHAHHWVLEVMAETGSVGLLLMLLLWVVLIRYVRPVFADDAVWPAGVALLAAMLPVVSLYSLFSSFWSICLWWLVVLLLLGAKHVKT